MSTDAKHPKKTTWRPDPKEMNRGTEQHYQAEWVENFNSNIVSMKRWLPVTKLYHRLLGTSALVVNAGPSLARVDFTPVEKNRDKIFLIVVDRAYEKVKHLHPDLVVTSEWKITVHNFLKDIRHGQPLLMPVIAHPKVCDLGHRTKAFVYQPHPELTEFGQQLHKMGVNFGHVIQGGSVGTLGASIAMYAGCGRIGMTGLDLCYSDGIDESWNRQLERTEDMNGNPVKTCRAFLASQYWYNEMGRQIVEDNKKPTGVAIELFNSSEAGLKIDYWKRISLDDYVAGADYVCDIRRAIRSC